MRENKIRTKHLFIYLFNVIKSSKKKKKGKVFKGNKMRVNTNKNKFNCIKGLK